VCVLVFTFNIDILSKENTSNINDLMRINKWECNSNDDCTAKNSVCSNRLCQCAPEYIFNADVTACVKGNVVSSKLYYFLILILIDFMWIKRNYRYTRFTVATRLYDKCEETVQCSAYLFSGAKCVENVCVCGPGSYYLHGRCNQYVGEQFFSFYLLRFSIIMMENM